MLILNAKEKFKAKSKQAVLNVFGEVLQPDEVETIDKLPGADEKGSRYLECGACMRSKFHFFHCL